MPSPEVSHSRAWSAISVSESIHGPRGTLNAVCYPSDHVPADDSWKVVGSPPSRRGSLSTSLSSLPQLQLHHQHPQHSPPRSPKDNLCLESDTAWPPLSSDRWGVFGGLHWENSALSDDHLPTPAELPMDPLTPCSGNSVLSVPMLPNVSLDPVYRQQRSFSFSVGQDPAFFGYDDLSDASSTLEDVSRSGYRTFLATMDEEEEAEPSLYHFRLPVLDHAAARERSQSSNDLPFLHFRRRASDQLDGASLGQHRHPLPSLWATQAADRHPSMRQTRPMSVETPSTKSSCLVSNDGPIRPSKPVHHVKNHLERTHVTEPTLALTSNKPDTSFDRTETRHRTHRSHDEGQDDPMSTTPGELGKGKSLWRLPESAQLYLVEFKAGRRDVYYMDNPLGELTLAVGDLVIVEGDRGRDLGKVTVSALTPNQAAQFASQKDSQDSHATLTPLPSPSSSTDKQTDVPVKRALRLATHDEINSLATKAQDEQRALAVCQQKIKHRKLTMQVVDAEYQWDRRKLTYYFMAGKRVDFRELVRDLFKTYKTRIWMCAVQHSPK